MCLDPDPFKYYLWIGLQNFFHMNRIHSATFQHYLNQFLHKIQVESINQNHIVKYDIRYIKYDTLFGEREITTVFWNDLWPLLCGLLLRFSTEP